jgi:hypothetical protein
MASSLLTTKAPWSFSSCRTWTPANSADLLQVIRVRVLGYLERREVIENQGELSVLDGDFCEREPALPQLGAAAVSGLTPAGAEERCRPPIALRGQLGVRVSAPLFGDRARLCATAEDARGREALVRYTLRPPIAQERLHLLANDLIRIELRRPFRDGTVAVDLDPLSRLSLGCHGACAPQSHGAGRIGRCLALDPFRLVACNSCRSRAAARTTSASDGSLSSNLMATRAPSGT